MTFAKIITTGSYLPQTIVTNSDLAQKVDTSDEWIVKRTGIQSRHIISAAETAVTMGAQAAAIAAARAARPEQQTTPPHRCLVGGETPQ